MYKDIPTKKAGIKVHITGYDHPNKQGHITLRGYPIDINGVRLDGAKTRCRQAKCSADVPNAEHHLVAAIEKALPRKDINRSQKASISDQNPIVTAFYALKGSNTIINTDWSSPVSDRWMSYFERNILPRIAQYDSDPFAVADRDLLQNALAAEIEKNGKSKGNRNTIIQTVKTNMASADIIYQALRKVDPTLPILELAPARASKTIQPEQVKSLPRAVRSKFTKLLEEKVETDPLLVLGAVCMWDAGTRTAEAAAVLPEDFAPIDNSPSISLWILWQEKNGKRNAILKSDAAYRRVPLSYWGTTMVDRCIKEICDWPTNKETAPLTANKLSSWIKAQLKICGCSDEYWAAAQKEELLNPERNSAGKAIYDVVAYVLRRDRASRWRNVCGLCQEIDYLLGHAVKLAKKRKINYALDVEQAKIAKFGERYIYNPAVSMHPAKAPIGLSHGNDEKIFEYEEMILANDSDAPLMVTVDIIAAEAAESIEVVSCNATMQKVTVRHLNTYATREKKPVIGTGQVKEDDKDESLG